MGEARICDIYDLLVRREADTVGSIEAIGDDPYVLRLGIESIYLVR